MSDLCWECDSEGPLMDHHVVPRIVGGTRTLKLCEPCHGKVHDRSMTHHKRLTLEGLKRAREQGRVGGRRVGVSRKQFPVEDYRAESEKFQRGEDYMLPDVFANLHNVSFATLRRRLKELSIITPNRKPAKLKSPSVSKSPDFVYMGEGSPSAANDGTPFPSLPLPLWEFAAIRPAP